MSLSVKLPWRSLRAVLCISLVLSTSWLTNYFSNHASAATNSTINFQARLMNASGSIVPDGNYNVEFKLYNALSSSGSSQGSCSGDANCLWVETRTSGNVVRVANGYLTVSLGSVTTLPSIDWNQDLYLGMNVGGTGTPSWDGEMTPRLHLTAVPYAFRAGQLASLAGAHTGVLQFAGSFGQDATITLPDPGASTATICYQAATACGFALGSGTNSYIRNQTTTQAANFNVQAATTGTVAGVLEANATGSGDILDLLNGSGVNVAAFGSGGTITLKPSATSTTAIQIQSGSNNILAVDNSNNQIVLGTASSLAGKLVFNNASNANAITLQAATSGSGSHTLTLPNETGTLCSSATTVCSLQTAYNASAGGTNPTISLTSAVNAINIQDTNGLGGGNFLSLTSQTGAVVFGFAIQGQYFEHPTVDSTTAFQVENSSAHSGGGDHTLFDIDTLNGYINIGSTGNSQSGFGTGSSFNGTTTQIETSKDANTTTIIGSTNQTSGTATINIGYTNNAGGNSVVSIGSGPNSAAGGTTTIQGNGVTITAGAASTWSTTAGALTIQSAAAATWGTAAGILSLQGFGGTAIGTPATSAGSTNSSDITLTTGNATGTTSTAGNIVLDVGTSTTSNGSILIGTANRVQTVTLGNTTTGTKITLQGAGITETLTNNTDTIKSSTTSANTFAVNDGTNNVFSVNTISKQAVLGTDTNQAGSLLFNTTTAGNPITINASTNSTASGYTLTLPTSAPTTGLCLETSSSSATQLIFSSCSNSNASITEVNETDNHGSGTTVTTVSDSPTTVGNLIVVAAQIPSGNAITSISGGGVTTWTRVGFLAGDGTVNRVEMWMGTVTSTGAGTITLSSSGLGNNNEIVATEYTASGVNAGTSWGVDTNGSRISSGSSTVTFSSLTPQISGELFEGYAQVQRTPATAGASSGFTYKITGQTNVVTYNTNVTAGTAYQPTANQNTSGEANTISAVFTAFVSSTAINNALSTQQANFNVQAATSGSVAGVLQANASGSGDILDLLNGSGTTVLAVSSTGNITATGTYNTDTITSSGFTFGATNTSPIIITGATQTTAATAGDTLELQGATGNTTGAGGIAELLGGTGGASGAGGGVVLLGGAAGGGNTSGGTVQITGGTSSGTGAGAGITLQGGAGGNAAAGSAGGNITLTAGNATGTGANAGGAIYLQGGTATSTGQVGAVYAGWSSGGVAPTASDSGIITSQLLVNNQLEIYNSTPGTAAHVSQLLFSNTSGSGNFRIGSSGGDIYWQGGGGNDLQMGAYWSTILTGDRQSSTPPNFVAGATGTSVYVAAGRDADIALQIQGNSSTQTGDLLDVQKNSGANNVLQITASGTALFKANTTSATAFQIQSSSSVNLLTVDTSSSTPFKLQVGSATANANQILFIVNNYNTATEPGEVDGAMYYNSSTNSFRCGQSGAWAGCLGGLLASNTASSTISNCSTACAAFNVSQQGTTQDHIAIPANYCQAGKVVKMSIWGTFTTPSNQNLQVGIYIGTSSTRTNAANKVVGVLPAVYPGSASSNGWNMEFQINCYSSTSVVGEGILHYDTNGTGSADYWINSGATATTINTTAQNLYIFPVWGTASVGNTITLDGVSVTGM